MSNNQILSQLPKITFDESSATCVLDGCLVWENRQFARMFRDTLKRVHHCQLPYLYLDLSQVITLDTQCEYHLQQLALFYQKRPSSQLVITVPTERPNVARVVNATFAASENIKLKFDS